MHDIHRTFPVLLGVKLSDAVSAIKAKGFTLRIKRIDDTKNNLGDGFIPLRVNLSVVSGVIVGYDFY